jgi:hypothetical protein
MSGGPKIRRGGRATHSSGQFRGIDVTASMSVFQTRHVGAAPTCRTNPTSSRSVREHARHFAEVEARGANPRGSTTSNTLHIVTVSIPCCERGGAGANPAVGTILFISCARRSRRASGSQVHVTQCESGAHVQFHRIRESQRTRLVWDQDRPGAAPGYPTNFGL